MEAVPLGGNSVRGKVPASCEVPSPVRRSTGTERALPQRRAQNLSAAGRIERDLYRQTVPQLCTPQPETKSVSVCRGWVLKFSLQRTHTERGLGLAET